VTPALIIAAVNAWVLWNEHWDHWAHKPALEDRTEFDYQNLRTKNYFWGDGDKVRLSHDSFLKSLENSVGLMLIMRVLDYLVSFPERREITPYSGWELKSRV
jgi:hypothetical protein